METSEIQQAAAALYSLTRTPGQTLRGFGNRVATLRTEQLGALALPTGSLVACDPLVSAYDAVAFERRAPVGSHPVDVSVATFEDDGDQRVAAAMLRITDEAPGKWDLALLPGQDIAALEPGDFYGYPVDSGTGCFASPEALARLADALDAHFSREQEAESDPLSAAMETTYVHTWGWADLKVDADLNVVAFHSGTGDGVYPTYWGIGASGSPVCVLTDFLVIDTDEGGG